MGKPYRGGKETSDNQRLKHENKKLKKQISKLRKVINSIDIQHYNFVQDLLNSQSFKDDTNDNRVKEKLEKQWECFQCDEGIMRLIMLHRAGEPYYLRKCDKCEHKTRMKKYEDGVEGV